MTDKKESLIAASDVISMFPTLVWRTQLSKLMHSGIDRAVLGAVIAMRRNLAELGPGESWQSDNDLQRLTEFSDLCLCVREATKAVLKFLSVSFDAFVITGCWVNVNAPGAAHPVHTHPNNYLSGVYYLQTGEGADIIYFHDPRPQTSVIRPPATELTAAITDQVTVTVRNGTLLLFPAWLPHSVPPNESKEHRISVSFNVMFSSYTETMSKPLW